jgi:hypothetical protein
MRGGGKRVSDMNSCEAKPVSFISLATIILFLHYLDETRKFPLFGSEEIPVGNVNEEIQMTECIGKSSLDPGKFPPSRSEDMRMSECIGKSYSGPREVSPFKDKEIPAGDKSKGVQMTEYIGKSNTELRKFPPFGSKDIFAGNGNDGTQAE